jgi:hypothetical protein
MVHVTIGGLSDSIPADRAPVATAVTPEECPEKRRNRSRRHVAGIPQVAYTAAA